ncbi:MAG TPA: sigma-70 family RNA polymerase sigma factor [Acidobacteriaceae bacterium]|nr:sigma-70 family RNA polymerase sigma factor [Acidobacteriaceae bacterium]
MALLPWKNAVRERVATPSAFEDLALPLLPALYNVASWLTQNATDAEDLVQETFLKALRGFDSFEPGSNFKAWIFRILRNTYLTSRSGLRARRTVSLDEQLDEQDEFGPPVYPEAAIDRATPELHLLRSADRATLHSAMEKLPAPLLEVILLCDVEEMKYKEIASVLDLPIGTVMSRIARARAALRKSLEGDTLHRESRA